jgi:hypothetical protein
VIQEIKEMWVQLVQQVQKETKVIEEKRDQQAKLLPMIALPVSITILMRWHRPPALQ